MFTERDIRARAVGFLRSYYRLRDRKGATGSRVTDKPHYYNGILIDARFSYTKPDGENFTATVEATSQDRAEEILYVVNWYRIIWHAVVIALSVMAVISYLTYRFWAVTQDAGLNLFAVFGRPEVYFVILSTFGLLAAALALGLSLSRGYRYIYAIAQFASFYADDQWLAYDEAIFRDLPGRYYAEFRDQAVRGGFGIMRVRKNEKEETEVIVDVAPSQIDQFAGERLQLPGWMARIEQAPQTLRNALPAPRTARVPVLPPATTPPDEALSDPLSVGRYLPAPSPSPAAPAPIIRYHYGRPKWYARPDRRLKAGYARLRRLFRRLTNTEVLGRRPGYYQLRRRVYLFGIAALVALGINLRQQSRWEPVARPDRENAVIDLTPIEGRDPATAPPPLPIEEGEYVPGRESDPFALGEETIERPDVEVVEGSIQRPENSDVFLLELPPDGEPLASFDCLPLARFERTVYLVLAGRHPTFEAARRAALDLGDKLAVTVTVARGECIAAGYSGYVVYLYEPSSDEGTVNFWVRSLFYAAPEVEVEIETVGRG